MVKTVIPEIYGKGNLFLVGQQRVKKFKYNPKPIKQRCINLTNHPISILKSRNGIIATTFTVNADFYTVLDILLHRPGKFVP
jgi:hypothetical protein